MANVEIIGFPVSTYVRAVRMVCEEKAIPYELKEAAPRTPGAFSIHPFGKIPTMRHGDLELYESKAIATYLDLAFPGPKLIPTDPRAAALTEQWVSLVNTRIDVTMIRTYLFAYILPKTGDGTPDRQAIEAVTPALNEEIGLIDRAVAKGGYLVGDQFTYADINLVPILFFVQRFPEGAAAIAAAKSLTSYYARIAARPSFQKTMPPMVPPQRQAKAS